METAAAILDSCDNVFSQCDMLTKKELLKISFLITSFILGTVDLITDWINWKQWSSVGGYDQHYLMHIFQTTFLCAAVVGTILWTVELFLTIIRTYESFPRHQKRSKPRMKSHEHNGHNGIILALFLGIFILGVLTLSNVYDTPILDWSMEFDTKMTKSIKADTIGPGLDVRQDGAMFVTMVYELPNWYHVGLYDKRDINIANSASVYQIQNRLYSSLDSSMN